jgi:DNA-binding MarR family transcriptional regulator
MPDPIPSLPPVLTFMRLLWLVDHGLQRASKRMRADLGITGPQRLAIRVIGRAPDISAGALAATLHVDPSTVTGILARLETAGLVTRRIDQTDRRRASIRLTPAGRRVDTRLTGTVEAAVQGVLDASAPRERRAAERLLGRLALALAEPPRSRRGQTARPLPSPARRSRP